MLIESVGCYCVRIRKPPGMQTVFRAGSKPEIGRVMTGRPSGVKIPWVAWLGILALALACLTAAGLHTVRGMSERGPAINQWVHQIQN